MIKARRGIPVPSQVNPEAALNGFRAATKQGPRILFYAFVFIRVEPGTYNNCQLAAEMLKRGRLCQRIVVIDSLNDTSTGMGLLLYKANQIETGGMSLDESSGLD